MARRHFHRPKKNIETDKEEGIELDGVVIENLPNAYFRVKLEATETEVLAHLSGKMRKNYVRVLNGDRVKVEMSPYDMDRARIVWKYR